MEIIEAECIECKGTGLYSGYMEPKGTAVICIRCDGSGCKEIAFTPFIEKKNRSDIQIVKRSSGSFIGVPFEPDSNSITYDEFQQGKTP